MGAVHRPQAEEHRGLPEPSETRRDSPSEPPEEISSNSLILDFCSLELSKYKFLSFKPPTLW